jgi:mannose-6-phosphate isomerase class I
MYTYRKTTQYLMPARPEAVPDGRYDIYPAYPIGPGVIEVGYGALARRLAGERSVVIDGFCGVLWERLRTNLDAELVRLGLRAAWRSVEAALLPAPAIDALVTPYLGGDDPIFGTRFGGGLRDFFDHRRLRDLAPDDQADISIVYGCGAALAGWGGSLVYVDVPKNEIQFRARARAIRNLGAAAPADPKPHYKRSYFVDWPALNRHRAELLPRIEIVIDEQRADEPTFMSGDALRASLRAISRSYVRPRPWFEPGPWGGQWLKRTIPGLPPDVSNLAWSFELISPENGICFESDGSLLEVAFDTLMAAHSREVLGTYAAYFGTEFPIRFDFLDTVEGGNLSLQCHPRPEYIRRHFGETFTQDETYYILDCAPGASVYLGFHEQADPSELRAELERSVREATPVDVERFINAEPAKRHDLFLIPSGTIHCSGAGNLVLEISATPYIFTFKMYDWMRLGLDGQPRPLNIERAFDNLSFEQRGARAREELISHQRVVARGAGWQIVHAPTHHEHFYDIRRFEFDGRMEVSLGGSPHVLMLVEGTTVWLETADGTRQRFSYAETFIVPAAAERYALTNGGTGRAKVVCALLKREWFTQEDHQWLTRSDKEA